MSTKDQTHSARLHGEALLAAQDEAISPALERLAEATQDPTERAEVASMLAAEAFAHLDDPEAGYRFIAAGLLLTSGIVDRDRLGDAVREEYDKAQGE